MTQPRKQAQAGQPDAEQAEVSPAAAGDDDNVAQPPGSDLPQTAAQRKATDPSVASAEDNESLEHTAGGMSTRVDVTDLGVPMLPGSPDEPTGPEDALGVGPKRGDYTNRIGPSNYHPHESFLTPEGLKIEAQRPRAEDRGDEEGVKGGTQLPT
jgi:hypothetical protein